MFDIALGDTGIDRVDDGLRRIDRNDTSIVITQIALGDIGLENTQRRDRLSVLRDTAIGTDNRGPPERFNWIGEPPASSTGKPRVETSSPDSFIVKRPSRVSTLPPGVLS